MRKKGLRAWINIRKGFQGWVFEKWECYKRVRIVLCMLKCKDCNTAVYSNGSDWWGLAEDEEEEALRNQIIKTYMR